MLRLHLLESVHVHPEERQLIVQPSFTDYSSGTPIHPLSKANLLSPILREEVDLSLFELYALNEDKEVLHFPSLDKWL